MGSCDLVHLKNDKKRLRSRQKTRSRQQLNSLNFQSSKICQNIKLIFDTKSYFQKNRKTLFLKKLRVKVSPPVLLTITYTSLQPVRTVRLFFYTTLVTDYHSGIFL